MRKDAENKDRQQHDIRVRAAKTKADYDALKQVYDKEFKDDSAELKRLRSVSEKEAEKVEPALLERYRNIKLHCTPPMAKLVSGQCSGCFMSLPSARLLELKNSIRHRTEEKINEEQKEYFLRQQIKNIRLFVEEQVLIIGLAAKEMLVGHIFLFFFF
jgi:ATP-dependent Lon protease